MEDPFSAVSRACVARHGVGAAFPLERLFIREARNKPSHDGRDTPYSLYRGLCCPRAMEEREREVLPRLVVRKDSVLSAEGPVPKEHTFELIEEALERFGKVLVWDLDGIERNRPNLRFIRRFEGEGLWVDAGIRRAESVIDVLVAGADRVAMGTKTIRDLEELSAARELTENLALLVDFAHGKLSGWGDMPRMAPVQLMRSARRIGIETTLVVDESFAVPRSVFHEAPPDVRLYAGIVPSRAFTSLPEHVGAIVDFWEVVPRKT